MDAAAQLNCESAGRASPRAAAHANEFRREEAVVQIAPAAELSQAARSVAEALDSETQLLRLETLSDAHARVHLFI